ncbi:uncharacterized protein OCT59_010293 [Rhizophagus irregularis]|uniref:Mitochondrion protein n=3 Tax=Rhizophagus irregularis TaxID=588596 RepID=A0A2N1NIB5_9GLOM|nr:hypothetical protein GLOIN_2v1555179 [Rhizophagus irregularis DAOM 181602=DAOM 197198]EXX76208.1 hypothetical protein RirG_035280 [Rhizophagus irregularis DAOM 197198w]PKK73662.1 hypothetical protein RhiirC2_847451 [Rhizophagus irregularis]POG76528.1 hypothetical protein GLOIN_2v1555179 [Rhizophagus irregularis DAOM 181602=DAOM 197198]UZO18988.1 hypothetical protein OCT59_010293 [Rhizophagus irregularis]CAB4386927.1 unnamed protein product [Rhizophagus irregularis]|eukprot:XP_025183394.1 hypothetical protein GLOIN_2v1555179 [Rhizophagus irregularis DAOM 181602=DAOM 197198]
MLNQIIKRSIFPITGSLSVFRPSIREQQTISIHKYFSTIQEQISPLSPDKPKEKEITIQPTSKAQYYFNTYKIVKDLEVQGFTRGQAEAIMRGMEALLINGFKSRSKLLSKADLENETYLFQASLSDLRIEIQIMRKNSLVDLSSENSLIQREVSSLHQKLRDDIGKMRHFIQLDINNYKADIREEQKKKEINIQRIDNKFTISSGDVRTDIEALKWETTRMALLGLFGLAVFSFSIMFFTSNKKSKEITSEVSKPKDVNINS